MDGSARNLRLRVAQGNERKWHLAGSCEAHAVGEDREQEVQEQGRVQEQPTGRQENGHPVVPFLAHCAAQVGPVQVIASVDALLRCDDDLEDDEEVDEEAKLRGCGVDQGLKGNLN